MSPLGLGSPLGASPLGLAGPLAMPAPPTAAALDIGHVDYPARSNKTGLFIGGGIAVAAVVIALALILKPEPPRPVQTIDPAALGIRTAAPVVEKQPELQAKPPATTSDEADAGTAKKTSTKWRPRSSSKSSKSTGSSETGSSSAAASPPAAPAKKSSGAGPCGCAPGDLMCNMKCSAGK